MGVPPKIVRLTIYGGELTSMIYPQGNFYLKTGV